MTHRLAASIAFCLALLGHAGLASAKPRCLTECTPRIGIVSAFGQEAALLVGQTLGAKTWIVNGNRFTTGRLRGVNVVIVLSGVSMINAAMTTQLMLDHFRVERLVMSGISGGIDPARRVGDVLVPEVSVGGRGVSGTAFLANPAYRTYLFEQLKAITVDMETASLAHVARANGVPYIAFRSLSDLAGAEEFNADVAALFASGLAETNEAAVTLAFLEAWSKRPVAASKKVVR